MGVAVEVIIKPIERRQEKLDECQQDSIGAMIDGCFERQQKRNERCHYTVCQRRRNMNLYEFSHQCPVMDD